MASRRERWARKFWAERSEFWQDTVKLQRAAATAAIVDRYDPKADPVYDTGPRIRSSWELACMPIEEREAISHANGWKKLGTGRWVKCYGPPPEPKLDRAPAYLGTASTFGSGRARFNHYNESKFDDIGDPGYIPDLSGPEAKEWCSQNNHPWVTVAPGYEGPASFGNRKDLERCLKETGHHQLDFDSNPKTGIDIANEKYRQEHGREFRPAGPVMRLNEDEFEEMFDDQ